MGIYNCEPTLAEALDSLMAQTYDDFHVIMCDDGSTDGTLALAQDYARRYPERFTIIANERNMGLIKSLNRCLELAQSELIARMDGDDISLPERFKIEVDYLDAHPDVDFVGCMVSRFDENGIFRCQIPGIYTPGPADFVRGRCYVHSTTMFRRKSLEIVGGYTDDARLLRVEDFDLWMKLYKFRQKGYNLPDNLYLVRDDRNAYRRRSWRGRVNEARCIARCIETFGLPRRDYIYAVLPILKYFTPVFVYNYFHRRQ